MNNYTAIQVLINSLVSAMLLSLVATGFTYIFRVTRVFHIAHGAVYVAAAFSGWIAFEKTGSWLIAASSCILVSCILIVVFEKLVYLPLSKRQSNQNISLIASMGAYIMVVNLLAMLFGNDNKYFNIPLPGTFHLGELTITKLQLLQFSTALAVLLAFIAYMRISGAGLVFQCVSDNQTISKVYGIDTEKVRLKVLIAGSVMAAAAALLKSVETGVDPQSGMNITLTAAVVAILSTRINTWLIIVLSILLTLIQNLVEWFANAQWKEGLTFLLLLLVIVYKTEGIISYNLRKDRQ